jgi:hypothetical protein
VSCLAATTRRTQTLSFETLIAALLEPTSSIHNAKRSPNSTSLKTFALGRFAAHESVGSSRDFETDGARHPSDGGPNSAIVFKQSALSLARFGGRRAQPQGDHLAEIQNALADEEMNENVALIWAK